MSVKTISVENANAIAGHLKAILDNQQAPQTLKKELREVVTNLFNRGETDHDAISDSFFNLRNTLLAHGGNGAAIEELDSLSQPTEKEKNKMPEENASEELRALVETQAKTRWDKLVHEVTEKTEFNRQNREQGVMVENVESDLPALISQVLNHPDVTNGIYDSISEALSEPVDGGGDSPEFVAASLGLKVSRSDKPRFSSMTEKTLDAEFPEANEVLRRISLVANANQDKAFIEDTIRLFRHMAGLTKVQLENFANGACRYLFVTTIDFDKAAAEFEARILNAPDSVDEDEQAAA